MRINQNISAMNTYSRLTAANNAKSGSLAKLSSGLRINKAGDDAAGLAISEKMRAQVGGLKQAIRNSQDGISLIQTAEGALNETHSILQRMRELAVQSSTDTNTDADRAEIQKEMDQLASEITRISNTTEFNTQKLINGIEMTDKKFHIGANKDQSISLTINAMDAKALGVARDKTTMSAEGAIENVSYTGNARFDGNIKFTYAAGTSATSAEVSATYSAPSGSDATFSIIVNGGGQLDITIADGASIGDAVTAINYASTAAGYGNIASDDGTVITLTSNTTGAGSSIEIVADSVGFIEGTEKGDDAGLGTVEISDGTTTQTIDVDGDATSLSVTTGAYKGLSFDMQTGTLADLTVTDFLTHTVEVASKANSNNPAEAPAGINVSDRDSANDAIDTIDKAIATVSSERSKLGSVQNRLEHTINNLTATAENLSAAESRIRDVDMAEEMMEFTKNNILSQAATSMLAQANQMPNSVLQLLQ